MSAHDNYKLPIIPFLLASLLASHGLRKKSLSPSGALTAFAVGFIMMASRLNTFGVSLIVFYLVGSRATKVGKARKSSLEDGHQEAGYRSGWQVLCNSFTAFVSSLLWNGLFIDESSRSVVSVVSRMLPPEFVSQGQAYSSDAWCPVDRNVGWSKYLLYLTLGWVAFVSIVDRYVFTKTLHLFRHFACCLGDTLASELGILSTSPPILITTLRRVPPGTNGGISFLGTSASVLGGVIMGVTISLTLILENYACRSIWSSLVAETVLWGALAGLFGSLVRR